MHARENTGAKRRLHRPRRRPPPYTTIIIIAAIFNVLFSRLPGASAILLLLARSPCQLLARPKTMTPMTMAVVAMMIMMTMMTTLAMMPLPTTTTKL